MIRIAVKAEIMKNFFLKREGITYTFDTMEEVEDIVAQGGIWLTKEGKEVNREDITRKYFIPIHHIQFMEIFDYD